MDYLPVGVLSRDLAESIEIEEIAPSYFDSFACGGSSTQQPFGSTSVPRGRDEMPIVAIVNVGYSFETACQSLSYCPFTDEPLTERIGPPRHLKGAIIRKNVIMASRSCRLKAARKALSASSLIASLQVSESLEFTSVEIFDLTRPTRKKTCRRFSERLEPNAKGRAALFGNPL